LEDSFVEREKILTSLFRTRESLHGEKQEKHRDPRRTKRTPPITTKTFTASHALVLALVITIPPIFSSLP
jgi:hypothetical protein